MNDTAVTAPADDHSLSKSLRPRHVTMITIGGIIGAGLFVGSSVAIAAAGPAILISYALTGTLVLLIMRALGEMAVEMPQVRSFTEFARAGLGNWAGFSVGWLYWYFWIIVIPVEAIAGANIIHDHYPTLNPLATGLGLMAVMTVVNLMPARTYGEFEFWFASIKVAAIISFIVIGGAHALGFHSDTGPTFANLYAHGGFAPKGWFAVLAAVTTVIFSMMGAEVVTIAAAESEEPAKQVAQMTATIISRILIFYVGSIFVVCSLLAWTAVQPGHSPFTMALETLHINGASNIMDFIILTAVLSCLNSSFYVASRVLFVLAEKGDAPHALVKTTRRHVPARSVLLASVAGFGGLIANYMLPKVVYAFLTNASGALIVVIYAAIVVSQVVVRRRRERAGMAPPTLPMWLFPWLSYIALAGMVAVLVAMAITPSHVDEFWASMVSIALVLVLYAIFRRGKGAPAPAL